MQHCLIDLFSQRESELHGQAHATARRGYRQNLYSIVKDVVGIINQTGSAKDRCFDFMVGKRADEKESLSVGLPFCHLLLQQTSFLSYVHLHRHVSHLTSCGSVQRKEWRVEQC